MVYENFQRISIAFDSNQIRHLVLFFVVLLFACLFFFFPFIFLIQMVNLLLRFLFFIPTNLVLLFVCVFLYFGFVFNTRLLEGSRCLCQREYVCTNVPSSSNGQYLSTYAHSLLAKDNVARELIFICGCFFLYYSSTMFNKCTKKKNNQLHLLKSFQFL